MKRISALMKLTLLLMTLTGCDRADSRLPPIKFPWSKKSTKQDDPAPNNLDKKESTKPGYSCGEIPSAVRIVASVFHEIAISKKVQIKVIAPDNQETLLKPFTRSTLLNRSLGAASDRIGFRKKAENNAVVYGYKQLFSFEAPGEGLFPYKFILMDAETGKDIDQKSVMFNLAPNKECGPPYMAASEPVDFVIADPQTASIDASKDYIPLADGTLLIVDPATSTATKKDTTEVWTDVETVRVLSFTLRDSSISSRAYGFYEEERLITDKMPLAIYEESGFDRGPLPEALPAHAAIETGAWWIDAITDTSMLVVYGKPKS